MYDSLWFGRDSRFHITDSVVPVCLAENLSAQNTLCDQANKRVESHDLRIPDAHDMQASRMRRLQSQALRRVSVHVRPVLDATSRALCESCFAKYPGKNKVTFGVAGVR